MTFSLVKLWLPKTKPNSEVYYYNRHYFYYYVIVFVLQM